MSYCLYGGTSGFNLTPKFLAKHKIGSRLSAFDTFNDWTFQKIFWHVSGNTKGTGPFVFTSNAE